LDDFAKLTRSERRDIIAEVATRRRVDFTIIEKDFWVCWTLRSLFLLPTGHATMVFKGGTSLSKAYGLIDRFSEDIDVVTDVNFYLAKGLHDPDKAPSKTQRLERMSALDSACAEYIGGSLMNELRRQFAARLGSSEG
jgi:Nucleotidyl transferase AbiEii toxin, Type IV TA system